jgi:UDP-N-acetylglucosamine 2-epimerase (non-hydrolysing)
MAPVYQALKQTAGIEPRVLLTGQHREQLDQALMLFGIPADRNLDVMVERQTLPELAARIIPQAATAIRELKPDYVLVHGDTLSTFAVAWAAFLERVPVGHVEAGLRSHDFAAPFPEEANRRLTDVIADLALAPTALARANLVAEGKSAESIVVTGQTAIDAIHVAAAVGKLPESLPGGPFVAVTLHRRESWPVLAQIARALASVARENPEYTFVYPVHLNPVVREAVTSVLEPVPNFVLMEPLEYSAMAALLRASTLIITDSGGIQEEAAALGVPVVVAREVTERPEGIETGLLTLAGTEPSAVHAAVTKLLLDRERREIARRAPNPYGDGYAGARVAQAVAWRLKLQDRPKDWEPIAADARALRAPSAR